MRCRACNVELTDYEATRLTDNGYLDLCNQCFKAGEYEFETYERLDLITESDIMLSTDDDTQY
jgi:hypothetical protein